VRCGAASHVSPRWKKIWLVLDAGLRPQVGGRLPLAGSMFLFQELPHTTLFINHELHGM